MPQQRDPLMYEVEDQVKNTVDLVLMTEPWTIRKQVLRCDEISVINHASTGGDVEIGLIQGGHFFALDTIFGLVADRWANWGHGFTYLSEWQIYAKFFYETDGNGDPCANGDLCGLHIIGYVLEPFSTP